MQGKIRNLGVILWAFGIVIAWAGCHHTPEVIIHPQAGAPVRVPVELALSLEARNRGLMYRRDLPPNGGMIFVFPASSEQTFWMKNTPLPLDMIFIGDDLVVVGIVENAVPFSTGLVGVGRPSRYVLEVHAGFAKAHQLRAGDRVEFKDVPPATS